jgi:hypothetical protein
MKPWTPSLSLQKEKGREKDKYRDRRRERKKVSMRRMRVLPA